LQAHRDPTEILFLNSRTIRADNEAVENRL
jgi:hypothetical protein